jgi:threonine/homoserine/homoserine lactone efflux protein
VDQSVLALIAFTFSAGMTPGPNNIMLMTSGVNFGFRRSVPHMAGVALGFPVMVAIIGVGFGATILALPWVHDAVSFIGIPYILWLAWHIAAADPSRGLAHEPAIDGREPDERIGRPRRPMSFLAASAFQWVNAKAWVMAIGMLALYAPVGYGVIGGIAIVIVVNVLIAILSSVTWTAFGTVLAGLLSSPRRLRVFNIAMALLLAATLIPAVIDLASRYL